MTQHITCIRSDGVGEQVLNIMSTILYTRYNNLVYAHTPFDRIHHLARYPIGDVENFFNLGYGEVKATAFSDCRKVNGFHSFINSNPEYFLDFIPSFKAKYYLTTKTCRFDRSKINVAIHIRRGDVREGHKGRHGYQRHTQNSKIREILDRISHLPFPFIFHIYSEGSPKDFQEFGDCILHLNEDVLDTFPPSSYSRYFNYGEICLFLCSCTLIGRNQNIRIFLVPKITTLASRFF